MSKDYNLIYNCFEDYVKDFPEAESYHRWITHNGRQSVIILKAKDKTNRCLLPGGYYWAFIGKYLESSLSEDADKFFVHIADGDDGEVVKVCKSEEEALQKFQELKLLVPFCLYDLPNFGYNSWGN